jgi:hypothetical protein
MKVNWRKTTRIGKQVENILHLSEEINLKKSKEIKWLTATLWQFYYAFIPRAIVALFRTPVHSFAAGRTRYCRPFPGGYVLFHRRLDQSGLKGGAYSHG